MLEEVHENDEDYYKPERVRNAFRNDTGDYNYIVQKAEEANIVIHQKSILVKLNHTQKI